jgi:hypothetical protein
VDFIRALLSERHTLYLDEIQLELRRRRFVHVSIPTLVRTLRRIHFSSKAVSVKALERNDTLRAAFMNKIGAEVPNMDMVMFADQSAKDDRTDGRKRGWSLVGTRCIQRRCFIRGLRYSILPILTLDGIIAYDVIEGSVTSAHFVQFLREMVVGPVTFWFESKLITTSSFHSQIHIRALVLFSYSIIVVFTTQKKSEN